MRAFWTLAGSLGDGSKSGPKKVLIVGAKRKAIMPPRASTATGRTTHNMARSFEADGLLQRGSSPQPSAGGGSIALLVCRSGNSQHWKDTHTLIGMSVHRTAACQGVRGERAATMLIA